VYRENGGDTGPIEVSSFSFFNKSNVEDFFYVEVADSYDRKLVTNMHDLGTDLSDGLFSAENAAADETVWFLQLQLEI
jgi:hypothetical protein